MEELEQVHAARVAELEKELEQNGEKYDDLEAHLKTLVLGVDCINDNETAIEKYLNLHQWFVDEGVLLQNITFFKCNCALSE